MNGFKNFMTNVSLNKIYCYFLLMSSTILLSSSSFFLTDYLTIKISNNDFSVIQFDYALKNNIILALKIQEKKETKGSRNWLSLNKQLAKSESSAALKLGLWFKKDTSQAILWFEQAIRLNSQEAIVELTQLYYQQDDLIRAKATLKLFSDVQKNTTLAEAALLLRFKMAIYAGESNILDQLLNSEALTLYRNIEIDRLLADIYKYRIVSSKITPINRILNNGKHLNKPLPKESNSASFEHQRSLSCITSLQLFATNLEHLKHLEQLIKKFKVEQALSKFICLPIPLYISNKRLECVTKPSEAITCNESLWQSVADKVDSRNIGLMLEKGGANVHLGILYFDVEDDVNVFSHEVSHLLGFVDEYPLINKHVICESVQNESFSHNIAVLNQYYQGEKEGVRKKILKEIPWADDIKESTPILEAVPQNLNRIKYWRLGTPESYKNEVGVYPSESCQKSEKSTSQALKNSSIKNMNLPKFDLSIYSAFKPLHRPTQLRYYSNTFPNEYIAMVEERPLTYLMPSFHYNIALSLYQKGKISAAIHWLKVASKWEKDPLRKKIILEGAF